MSYITYPRRTLSASLVGIGVLAALLIAPARLLAGTDEATCADGRFLPRKGGAPIVLSGPLVALETTCAPAPVIRKTNGRFVRIRARWDGCTVGSGRVTLRAKIDVKTCDYLTGVLRVEGTSRRQKLRARRSVCGDRLVDAGASEECEPAATATCGDQCRRNPACGFPDSGPNCIDESAMLTYNVQDPLYGAVCNGVADDGNEIQAAINAAAAAGGGIVLLPKICGVGAERGSLQLKSGVHLRCDGAGGLRALSGVSGNGMVIDAGTSVQDASIRDCVLDAGGRSGVEAVRLVTTPRRVRIESNRFLGGNTAYLLVMDANGSGQIITDGNFFVGSNVDATNDNGIEMRCGSAFSGIGFESGCSITNTNFYNLGGKAVHVLGGGVELDQVEVVGVYDEALENDGVVSAANLQIVTSNHGSNRRSLLRLRGSSLFVNLNVNSITGKNIIESTASSHILSISGGFLAGGIAGGLTTGVAATPASTTQSITDTSKSWLAGEWIGYEVAIVPGAGCALIDTHKRWITGNTGSVLQWVPPLPAEADGCSYEVTGGGMVVVRNAHSVLVTGVTWDYPGANNVVSQTDQLVLVDVANADVTSNAFSAFHITGNNAVRVVTTNSTATQKITLVGNQVLLGCTGCGSYSCFLFDKQTTGLFEDVLIVGNNVGSPPLCNPALEGDDANFLVTGNLGF